MLKRLWKDSRTDKMTNGQWLVQEALSRENTKLFYLAFVSNSVLDRFDSWDWQNGQNFVPSVLDRFDSWDWQSGQNFVPSVLDRFDSWDWQNGVPMLFWPVPQQFSLLTNLGNFLGASSSSPWSTPSAVFAGREY